MNNHREKAITVLQQGGIVIFPTDTAFGIGCRIDDEAAVQKLFSLRKRPSHQAVPVLFDSIAMVNSYVTDIPNHVEEDLMKQFWPGALTIILPADLKKVPKLVRGGGLTIGARVPSHEIPLSLIAGLQVPLIGTSANFHGEPTPYSLAAIDPRLLNLVDYMVPGVTSLQQESTIIDCTIEPWLVRRKGAVSIDGTKGTKGARETEGTGEGNV